MIRWITDRLGTASYYAYERDSETTDSVVIDVRELLDREGNTDDLLMMEIQAALEPLQAKQRVVICCDKGISRSNAIALGVLMGSGMSYEDALDLLAQKVDASEINLGLLHDIRSLFGHHRKQTQRPVTNLLVTGSTGFVGRSLVNALRSEYEIFCLHRNDLDLTRDTTLLDLYINKNHIDFIVHLAHPKMRNGISAMAESVAMMRNVLEVCRLNGVGLLYLSGLVVFSGYTSDTTMRASSSLKCWPKGVYGETKFLCEELVKIYQKTYNLEAFILRPSALYGQGMDRAAFVSKFLEAAIKGVTIRTHRYCNGLPVFDFLYLDDLIDAIRAALRLRPGITLNIGTGKAVSTFELAQSIVRVCGSASSVETIDMDDETYKIVVDPSEAATHLGWKPRVDLSEGLKRLWHSYRCD